MRETRRITTLLTALLLSVCFVSARGAEDEKRSFALRAGKIYTVSGDVLTDAMILVQDGKIAAISASGGKLDVPAGFPLHDLRAHVVLPGLIDAETTLASGARDTLKSIAPEVRAVDGWDFFRDLDDVLEGGVTTVYVSPGVSAGRGSTRLVSGRGAAVKTAGRKSAPLSRVLRDGVGIQVTLGELSRRQPSIYDPPVAASPDNPFEVLRPPLPQSRAGEFLALRKLIGRAREYRTSVSSHLAGLAAAPSYDAEAAAIFPLLDGADHLRVRANKARDIYHVLELARETGVPIVLEGAAEAERLTSWLVEMKVPVIFPGAFRPGQLPGGDLASPAIEGRLDEEAILRMQKAGVKIILNSPSDGDVKNLLLQAAFAVRLGMDPGEALNSITLYPAEVLGISDRVGSIAVGKDADFVVLGGDPFGPDNRPQAVVIEGEVVHRDAPEVADGVTVVRCGRILTGKGGEIRGGVVLVKDGKIEYAGAGAFLGSLEKAARVIDATRHTVVPGLIDAGGTAGLRVESLAPGFGAGDGSSGASANAALRLVDSIDPRDPSLRRLVRVGITTAIITPPRGRDVSGQVSALKLAAAKPDEAVMEPYAALYFGAVSSRTIKSAKGYHDAWKKWEDKRDAAGKAGKEFKDEAPKKSDAYEPFRALFEKKVPAMVETTNRASVEVAVKLLKEQYGVRLLVAGLTSLTPGDELEKTVNLVRGQTEGAIIQTPFLRSFDKDTINWPEVLSSRGVSLSVRSRVATGARLLPLQLAYAVREGWYGRHALRAMTSIPAKQFGIDERVGSIEKGKDADLVILSGAPFAVTTRVLGVMVDGRLVHGVDELEEQVEN